VIFSVIRYQGSREGHATVAMSRTSAISWTRSAPAEPSRSFNGPWSWCCLALIAAEATEVIGAARHERTRTGTTSATAAGPSAVDQDRQRVAEDPKLRSGSFPAVLSAADASPAFRSHAGKSRCRSWGASSVRTRVRTLEWPVRGRWTHSLAEPAKGAVRKSANEVDKVAQSGWTGCQNRCEVPRDPQDQ
jgi:hypothetical protein